ncbi:MAG TPA: site-specific DNA-methyltransferase [Sedimentisphaerales bacterium]|nr:site-specific DNA-methyltransferase [Sedimentisphaerales bacterium]
MQKVLNEIICGDCIEVLGRADEAFADLIFADPPFNIGYKYDKYYDKRKRENYIAWTREWMAACKQVLKPHGSFYVAIGDDYAANVKIIADELELFMRNWIIWHYTFGQQTKNKFARSHTHIFYFVSDKKKFTFNDHAVRVPSDRQLIYNDRRANPAGKMPNDVWTEYSRVCGTFRERTGWHPCQMPESLLKRIIAVSSNPGDCVLDPFSGSGTTAAAAYQLGRNYVGVEISEKYVENARERLAGLRKQGGRICFFNSAELNELKRLLGDMEKPAREIAADKNLLNLIANQFTVRMNNAKRYRAEEVVTALRDLAD